MRVCHVITGLNRGGAEHVLFRLLSQMPDAADIMVVSLTGGGIFQDRLEGLGIRVECLGFTPGLPSPGRWWRLVKLLKQWQPAVVQTWMYHADLAGGLAAKYAGIPVCWGIRNSVFSTGMRSLSTRLVVHFCAAISRWVPTRVVSCSEKAASIHQSLGYSAPFDIVPNGLDVESWRPQPQLRCVVRSELALADSDFVFAHAGRADPLKDHAGLARAFNEVLASRPNARLLLCGQGLQHGNPYFEGLPFTRAARAAVVAMGPRDDLQRLWQASDCFVLSSIGEAFPNVVAEAMACALPCVVSDVGDAAMIVGETGVVVPPSDQAALADAMLSLCNMPHAERDSLGIAARQRVLNRFTLNKMVAGYERTWAKVIAKEA